MNPAPLTLRRVLPPARRPTDFRFSIVIERSCRDVALE
jgi:hypothetical protein